MTTIARPIPRQSFLFYRSLTFFSLMVGYGAYYLCRQNLGFAYGPMKQSLGITMVEFGWLSSLGTFAYALGKFFLGSMADSKLGGKYFFYLGLFGSALLSFTFGIGNSIVFFLVIWALNRTLQSFGWSGLVNVMSNWFPKSSYGTAMATMSVSYQLGGALVSLYAGFLLSLGHSWRVLFFVPSLTLALIGVLTYPMMVYRPELVGYDTPREESESSTEQVRTCGPQVNEALSYRERFLVLFSNRAFLGMLALSFIVTFLRECFNLWTPAYFSSLGETPESAAYRSSIFPFFGCVGTLFAGWFSDRFCSARRSPVIAVMLIGLMLCLFSLSRLTDLSGWMQVHIHDWFKLSRLATLLVGVTGFFLLGSYSFTAGVVALDFGGSKIAGTAAGLLDGVGYLGATLAGVGIAKVVVQMSWSSTFILMLGCAFLAIVICGFLWKAKA